MDPLAEVKAYHERTKHHFRRFAASAGYLDWANQPDPFRRFEGSVPVALRFVPTDSGPAYDELFAPGVVAPAPLNAESLSAFFQYSLALSAWKALPGTRWALRVNPSSGNLHPMEGYLLSGPVDGLFAEGGVFHYAPREHALERRCAWNQQAHARLTIAGGPDVFLLALTSIHWREAWKYGERAYRYCQHDAGHAVAALSLSAATLGWHTAPVASLSDNELSQLLGLDRAEDFAGTEREHPDLMIAVYTKPGRMISGISDPPIFFADIAMRPATGRWTGRANRLSTEHVDWEWIDRVTEACAKPPTESALSLSAATLEDGAESVAPTRKMAARRIIHQRRSAVALDGKTRLSSTVFFRMLERTMPRFDQPPWSALGRPVCVHLGLFVHLVDGLPPGLYLLVRESAAREKLRAAMHKTWDWEPPEDCRASLPLFRLTAADCRRAAGQVSCGQAIAAEGAFSCGMIAEFDEPLARYGPWFYRRLFWETGVIGQVLYLEAEAAGLRGTGIGCFFDDPVHELFGLTGTSFQSLYHFTVGGPVEDPRLTTLPPYEPQP